MQTPPAWIWQQPDWPRFRWDEARLAPRIASARFSQGKVLGAARLLDRDLTQEARFWLRHQATVLNERQRKVLNRLLDAGPDGFEGGMNTRKYLGLTRISRATAYRELADLVAKGCLRPTGKGGRSSGYEIAWPG